MREVSRSLELMNQVAVPLGKHLLQLESDSGLLRREVERRFGRAQWDTSRWNAKPLPNWLLEGIRSDINHLNSLVSTPTEWADTAAQKSWKAWAKRLDAQFASFSTQTEKLRSAVERNEGEELQTVSSELSPLLEEWGRLVKWGTSEHDRLMRRTFSEAQSSVEGLRTALEGVLVVVLALSLLVVWLGERALRPLASLTRIARDITQRGLKSEDRAQIGALAVPNREDEVGTLAREFHRMATALLERGLTVEQQADRLAVQNRLLEEMGELNASILRSIEQILIVFDQDGRIRLVNPAAKKFLSAGELDSPAIGVTDFKGTHFRDWELFRRLRWPLDDSKGLTQVTHWKVGAQIYDARWMPLRPAEGRLDGQILVLEEVTEKLAIESRLKSAEHLAAIGRMSAQVAHEVRNPLHSIGLEAELALEVSQKPALFTESSLKYQSHLTQSVRSILKSVDRLETITGNYLKLSRLSAGKKERVDLAEILEEVLATYASVCEAQGVFVDWKSDGDRDDSDFFCWVDRDLIENAMGNLFKNALQAVEGVPQPKVAWRLGKDLQGMLLLSISDNGPGISPEVKDRIFTPFVTSKAQGTGLGLSFSKQVFEEHGGSISSSSESSLSLGGACFEIRIPAAPPTPPNEKVAISPAHQSWMNATPEFSPSPKDNAHV